MFKKQALLLIQWLLLSSAAMAAPITYAVTVNTSSIKGVTGALDFNFNPGPLSSQAASIDITNFMSDGLLVGSSQIAGAVSGTLPSMVTINNTSGLNDYFRDFTYGNNISFDAALHGAALSAPDGVSTSGSTFAFSMFSNSAGTIPTLTTNITNGFASTIDVNLDGSTTLTNYSLQTSVVPEISADSSAGALALLLGSTLILRGASKKTSN